jgi:hypothetical protein
MAKQQEPKITATIEGFRDFDFPEFTFNQEPMIFMASLGCFTVALPKTSLRRPSFHFD